MTALLIHIVIFMVLSGHGTAFVPATGAEGPQRHLVSLVPNNRKRRILSTRGLVTSSSSLCTTTMLEMSLKPAAMPLMDSGKALARSGELLIEMTRSLELYGGGLSAAGAQIRNAGDCLAQAAASCRFKTGTELVLDEMREAATCLQDASQKCKLAKDEAQANDNEQLEQLLVNMIGPMAAVSQGLEAAGAGILQRAPLKVIGSNLVQSSQYLEQLAAVVDDIAQSSATLNPIAEGALSSQRMKFAAEKMREAGNELQGKENSKPIKKSWLQA